MQRLPTVPVPIPSRLYYGWVIVATGLAINMATTPLNPVVFSFFIKPMSEEMGWSLGALSLATNVPYGGKRGNRATHWS